MKNPLLINPEKTTNSIVKFLKDEFSQRSKKKAILGLSGGIDSSVVAFLCQKAGLNLQTALLPYKFDPRKDCIVDSKLVIEALKLSKEQVTLVDIAPAVDAQIKALEQSEFLVDRNDKGNIMARQRMIIFYFLARNLGGLVVGTENLSEYYLGYFTLHGDQAADINPIGGLFKTQVIQLASYLGLPEKILKKAPSAGLWNGQTDEGEMGFNYQEADLILYWAMIKKYPEEKIIRELGFDKNLVKKVLGWAEHYSYKRGEIPKWNYF